MNRIGISLICGGVKMDDLTLGKLIDEISATDSKPLTLEILKTNCIVNAQQLIIEIEKLESTVLTTGEHNLSYILLAGAKLRTLTQEVIKLSNYIS